MQSVLVTIDRHEWYAAPQIYTRDDSTGLWSSKPAFQPGYISPSPTINIPTVLLGEADTARIEHMNHGSVELTDGHGVSSMETNCERVSDEANAREEIDIEIKKRRVEEDSTANEIVLSDCSLNGTREVKPNESVSMESTVTRDYLSATVASANASVAECVIEPTLVMFEVTIT